MGADGRVRGEHICVQAGKAEGYRDRGLGSSVIGIDLPSVGLFRRMAEKLQV